MNCRLTVVVDNRAKEPLVAEHGFSLHIDTGERVLLLDTGDREAFDVNLERLELDRSLISTLVLSHGHYDHTGGVAGLLEGRKMMDIFLHGAVFQPRYSLDGEQPAIVRMPLKAMEAISHHPDERVHWLTRPVLLDEGVGITGPIPRRNDFEDTGGPFFLDPEGKEIDSIVDDVAVWLDTPDGLVICVGCCHSGLVNTVEAVFAQTGKRPVRAIVGGLHLLHSSSVRLEKTVAALGAYDIRTIVACHCSGDDAVSYLASHLDAEVVRGEAGMVLEF